MNMLATILIIGAGIPLIFFLRKTWQLIRKNISFTEFWPHLTALNGRQFQDVQDTVRSANTEPVASVKQPAGNEQLKFALFLIKEALPVWESFCAVHEASYKTSPGGKSIPKIESNLPGRAIEQISLYLNQHFPHGSNHKINNFYAVFVGPVIAMQDGIWICPYPVKKFYLAIYFLLKGIIEEKDPAEKGSLLSKATHAALDCLELSKLYDKAQIASFAQHFKAL